MLHEFDINLKQFMRRYGLVCLRLSLAIVFLYFGILKLFDASPIMKLVKETYPFFPFPAFTYILGGWEVVIGLGLLMNRAMKVTLGLLFIQMLGTFAVIIFNFHAVFAPYFPLLSLEGEFIVKNLAIVAAGFTLGAHVD